MGCKVVLLYIIFDESLRVNTIDGTYLSAALCRDGTTPKKAVAFVSSDVETEVDIVDP